MEPGLFWTTFWLSIVTYFSAFSLGLVPAFITYQRRVAASAAPRAGLGPGLAAVAGMTVAYLLVGLPAAAAWGEIPGHRYFAIGLGLAFVGGGLLVVLRGRPGFGAFFQASRSPWVPFLLGAVYGVAALGVTHYCPELVVANLRAGNVGDAVGVFAAYLGGKGLLLLAAFVAATVGRTARPGLTGMRWAAGVPMAAAGLYIVLAILVGLPLMPPTDLGH